MSTAKKKRLGRGLTSLVGSPIEIQPPEQQPTQHTSPQHPSVTSENQSSPSDIPVHIIDPNIFQPRRMFDEEELAGLADSIRQHGVMQPIVVRPSADGRYELIAGERRLRAARLVDLKAIPAVVCEIDDRAAAEWALVENIQRQDLNTVERARGLARLRDEFAMTQSQIAESVGIDRSSVANLIRILALEDDLLELIASDRLTLGHAKALLSHPSGDARVRLGQQASSERWTVRHLENVCSNQSTPGDGRPSRAGAIASDPTAAARSAHLRNLEATISEQLGTRVHIVTGPSGKKGSIRIEFFDAEHFEGLANRLGISLNSSF